LARGSPGADRRSGVGARLSSLDERLLLIARTRGHTSRRERAVARFSQLGEHGAVWLAIGAAGALIDRRGRGRWRAGMRAVAAAYALNTAIKPLVGRRRPELAGLPPLSATPTRLSFPSAHASTSFAGALAYSRAGLPAPPLYALALALSLSRLYLGVHHPSDVLAGALLGTVVAGRLTRAAAEPPAAVAATPGQGET
jgi:decaprenylphosphoryl-5-phosphoribose phosphatase